MSALIYFGSTAFVIALTSLTLGWWSRGKADGRNDEETARHERKSWRAIPQHKRNYGRTKLTVEEQIEREDSERPLFPKKPAGRLNWPDY